MNSAALVSSAARAALWELLPDEIVERIVGHVRQRLLKKLPPWHDRKIKRIRRVNRAFAEGLRIPLLLAVHFSHPEHPAIFMEGIARLLWDAHDAALQAQHGSAHVSQAPALRGSSGRGHWNISHAACTALGLVAWEGCRMSQARTYRTYANALRDALRKLAATRGRPKSLAMLRMTQDAAHIVNRADRTLVWTGPEGRRLRDCFMHNLFEEAFQGL